MIYNDYGCQLLLDHLDDPTSPQYFGIECEIEAVKDHGKADSIGWNVTQDGSLRNNGYEYISSPIILDRASDMFQRLHGSIKLGKEPFSQRTSIHIHANCANLESNSVRQIVLLYALFEEAFFLMCSPERRDNIHCTPLTETYLPGIYGSSLNNMVSRWHKYTALNLKPLAKYGTLEFRHMQGHNDVELLDEWLNIIGNLISLGKRHQINQESFDEKNIQLMFMSIFGRSRLKDAYPLVRSMMANQILDVKLGVM